MRRPLLIVLLGILVPGILLQGCSDEPDPNAPFFCEGACDVYGTEVARLEIHPLDIWAQYLPAREATLTVNGSTAPLSEIQAPVMMLNQAEDYTISLTAEHHQTLNVTVRFNGSDALNAVTVQRGPETEQHGVILTHQTNDIDGRQVPVHSLYLGLNHSWFSAQGRPARRGNDLTLFIDGEAAYEAVYSELMNTTYDDPVLASTWWFESDFELIRPAGQHETMTEEARREYTALNILESIPANKRVLVGLFLDWDGYVSGMTHDDGIDAHGEALDDNFEFLVQPNLTRGSFRWEVPPVLFQDRLNDYVFAQTPLGPNAVVEDDLPIPSTTLARDVDLTAWPIDIDITHASWHQKFWVIGDVAFIGGMNLRRSDWDTEEHLVFEPRRMLFDSTTDERVAVANREELPDLPPRKDYMIMVDGPTAQDAADTFHTRWEYLINTASSQENPIPYQDNATDFDVNRTIAPVADGVQAQVTTTMPAPFSEYSIAESWVNAVRNANEYIFIEDQYFRIPMLVDEIVQRMTEVPDLRLIVITQSVDEWTDPGCIWTHLTHQEINSQFPDRYMMLTLRAFDYVETWGVNETESRFADMNIHSKMLIVDDIFMSVGSCNKNNRGVIFEGEMNLAVLDEEWVAAERRRILANMLPADMPPADDVNDWWNQLYEASTWNESVYDAWDAAGFDISLDGAAVPDEYIPRGFLYPLYFGAPEDCLLESIGPDMV